MLYWFYENNIKNISLDSKFYISEILCNGICILIKKIEAGVSVSGVS